MSDAGASLGKKMLCSKSQVYTILGQNPKFTLFLVNQEYSTSLPPPTPKIKIVQDSKLELAKNTSSPDNENYSGLWIGACQETPPPPMKIVQDFILELAKNTPTSTPENENCSGLWIWACKE